MNAITRGEISLIYMTTTMWSPEMIPVHWGHHRIFLRAGHYRLVLL